MNDVKVEAIANKLNVSKSTVSKTIRHCSGVDSYTRQRILEESRELKLSLPSECAVYVILPDVPQYFWKNLRKGIIAGSNAAIAPVKYNIYTKTRDEAAVLEYLEEAKRLNALAIILATHITPAIHKKLETMVEGRLIILLSEYHELTNCFYIGGDAYRDGYTMGKQYLTRYPDRKLVIFSPQNHHNAEKRLDSFLHAVKEERPELVDNASLIKLDNRIWGDHKLIPSKLAPLLVDAAKGDDPLCIYSPTGIPQFPLALIKARLTDRAVCLCHDCYMAYHDEEKMLSDEVMITCDQDVYEQGVTAAKIATDFVKYRHYPENKRTFIPSIFNISK